MMSENDSQRVRARTQIISQTRDLNPGPANATSHCGGRKAAGALGVDSLCERTCLRYDLLYIHRYVHRSTIVASTSTFINGTCAVAETAVAVCGHICLVGSRWNPDRNRAEFIPESTGIYNGATGI